MGLEITLFASLVEVLQMKLVSWFNLENKSIFSFSRTKTTKGLSGALLLYSLVLCTVMRVCVCVCVCCQFLLKCYFYSHLPCLVHEPIVAGC